MEKNWEAVHYIGKNNAIDTEVFIGREFRHRKIRFYIADFDLSSEIKDFNKKTIEEMRSSISDIPYYPKQKVNKKLYKLFYNGYCSVVPLDIAIQVFSDYD